MSAVIDTPPLAEDPSNTPGALLEHKTRELRDGGLIEFELAPYGWLTRDGERRRSDYRAYYFTPAAFDCAPCEGSGRIPGKRDGSTKQCPTCKATGAGAKRVRLPSVTTLLDSICPKPGIPPWSEARGIQGAVEAVRRGLIDPDDEANVAMAVELVRANRLGADRARDEAATRGLNVHGCLEQYALTGEPPNPADHPVEHWGYIRGLARWLLKADPEPVAIEQLVAHPELGYAGRLDLRANIGGLLTTVDLKTQENGGLYSTAHLQVGMYELAAQRCGDEPASLLTCVVVAANGEFREMAANHDPSVLRSALDYYAAIKPIDAMCASANRLEREARKEIA
jgi:hypothetical protein